MQDQNEDAVAMFDGEMLPMDAIAVRPYCEEDLAALVVQVPVCLAGELARLAAWRALGMEVRVPADFSI